MARPRLLMLDDGGVGTKPGPLLLAGGRLYTEHTRDVLLWVCWDGMGRRWEPYSISYRHNLLVSPAALRFSADVNATTGRATTSYFASTSFWTVTSLPPASADIIARVTQRGAWCTRGTRRVARRRPLICPLPAALCQNWGFQVHLAAAARPPSSEPHLQRRHRDFCDGARRQPQLLRFGSSSDRREDT